MNSNQNENRVGVIAFVVAVLLLAAGCESDPTGGHGEEFFAGEGEHRDSSRFMHAQAAARARKDGTLRDVHFDGDTLNSLGRDKLDLMMTCDGAKAGTDAKMVVHMDVDEDAMKTRVKSVTDYLKAQGIASSRLSFESGENDGNYHPVAPDLAAMDDMAAGTPADAEGSSGPSGMTAASMRGE